MQVKLTDSQFEFFDCTEKFALFTGGIGAGKSTVGSVTSLKNINIQPKAKGFIGANTYRQLQNSTLAAFFSTLDQFGMPFTYNKNEGKLHVLDTEIICMSLENYNVIRGMEIGWFWLDEVRDTKEEAFIVLMGRLRDKNATWLNGRLTSSPSGFNWLYDYFVGAKKTDDFKLVQGSSLENPFLPKGYIDTLKASYDEKMYEQEVMGQFINIQQGRVYYAFKRTDNLDASIKLEANHQIMVGMDFNINPMSAVVAQEINGVIQVIDELSLMSSNTNEIADELKNRFGQNLLIIPDSTGKAIKTSAAGLSDHQILMNAGFRLASVTNPYRGDRYNAVNNAFEKKKIKVHPKCQALIKDLEQVSFKEGSNHPDTSDSKLTHISDALGYLVWHLQPIEREKFDSKLLPRRGGG